MIKFFIGILFLALSMAVKSQSMDNRLDIKKTPIEDTLYARNHHYRNWWDVEFYEITIQPNYQKKKLENASTKIRFKILSLPQEIKLQIDLQHPMKLDSAYFIFNHGKIKYAVSKEKITHTGDFYYIDAGFLQPLFKDAYHTSSPVELSLQFSGSPIVAKNPPWDGGWIFTRDKKGRPWMTAAVQGKGASTWFPCKDYFADEPQDGMIIHIVNPAMPAISNGREINKKEDSLAHASSISSWQVKNPINLYNIIPYIGQYTHFSDTIYGVNKQLSLDYYVLDYNKEKAQHQFKQIKPIIQCYESWLGPYPFYKDGFKVVEAPYAGMEHQSAVAYGNMFENGYLGEDVSSSSWGLKFDYILVHEIAHEWFGNSISTKDLADMWIHESFATYAEVIYVECRFGKKAAEEYIVGTRQNIENKKPIAGVWGINKEGSEDMYYKGSNMLHTLRAWLNDEEKFKEILQKMNQQYYHKTVSGEEIEQFFAQETGKNLKPFFNQYLRTTLVPVLEYEITNGTLYYRWANTVDNFNMPLRVHNTDNWLLPSSKWQEIKWGTLDLSIDPAFYIKLKKKLRI